jgi:methionyl-tRNA formyltransferase
VSKVRVCFCGTPEFAVTSLKRVLDDEHFEVVGVVTQPDRPAGRKMTLTPSPIKTLALAHGLTVISPEKINQDMVLQEIKSWNAEVAIVVAYGQILSQRFLDLFALGAVNVHGSILPRWRGAAPIQRAVEAGDTETGVALQKVVKALDAGDVLGVRRVQIGPDMNAQELHDELAVRGADLLHIELMDYVRGNLAPFPQEHALATYAKKIDKTESELKWDQPAHVLHNKVRAFVMGPGTYTLWSGKKLKIHRTQVFAESGSSAAPGTVLSVEASGLRVACGEGSLLITELQPESRNRMSVADFLKGQTASPLGKGEVLGV